MESKRGRDELSGFALRVRADTDGYYRQYRGNVVREYATREEAESIRRGMLNGAEFETIEISQEQP